MVSSNNKSLKAKNYSESEDELRTVDAVLAAFCYQTGREKQYTRRLKIQAVYRTFADLRNKYPTWLQDVSFTYGPADTVPISGVLEDILFDLGASGIMGVENPWYRILKISTAKLVIFKEAINKRRDSKEQGELRHLADDFDQIYNKYARMA
jgi:hypothetical protein